MIDLDITAFRNNFELYYDEVKYTDTLLGVQYEIGKCYIADNECTMDDKCREYALQSMLAHLLYIRDQVNAGNNIGVITQASEGDVSVSLAQPVVDDEWHHWFNSSPFGRELVALLGGQAVGGFYAGGNNERLAFRKAGGVF
mgnify:CR=1 FL=1|tara:strand:- start:2301 stop:2726 length:426 start_codon:yes stop_codon:yes gene_type:complete